MNDHHGFNFMYKEVPLDIFNLKNKPVIHIHLNIKKS